MKSWIIEGANVRDIPSFYAEINRIFMQEEDWNIAPSLDAFNDLLYGGFGALKDAEEVHIIWMDSAQSAAALGLQTTRAYYEAKVQAGTAYNHSLFKEKLEALVQGKGKTYFEIVQEIIKMHPRIILENR